MLCLILNTDDPWAILGVSAQDAEAEFVDVWDCLETLYGEDPLLIALKRARNFSITPPARGKFPAYRLFVSMAAHLQAAYPQSPILLPVHKIAPLLEVSAQTISRYRQWASAQKLIVLTARGRYSPDGGGEADEFQFNLAKFPELKRFIRSTEGSGTGKCSPRLATIPQNTTAGY